MKTGERKFRELQRHWYKILEESGFEDIEEMINGRLVLKQSTTFRHNKTEPFDCQMDQEYFRQIYHRVNDELTTYRNEEDKIIMQLYAEGTKIKIIIEELKSKNLTRCRRHIRTIIRQYEMAWNIKNYSPRQLNKYG